jgi:hypothetical protein
MSVRLIKHEAVPHCGSFEVRFSDGRPSTRGLQPTSNILRPDCRFEGTWHDWERDEWMTLGCLKVKDEHREGSYGSATGPQALSTSLAKRAKGKATISAHRSRSKMLKTLRRSASQRPPKGLHVLRSSLGRRMNKFVRPALPSGPPSFQKSYTRLSEDGLSAAPKVDAQTVPLSNQWKRSVRICANCGPAG